MPKQTSPSQVLYPIRPEHSACSQFTETQWNFKAVAIGGDMVELTNLDTATVAVLPCQTNKSREEIKDTLNFFVDKPISDATMAEIIAALEKKCTELYNAGRCNECPEGDESGYCEFEGCHLSPYRWCEYDD